MSDNVVDTTFKDADLSPALVKRETAPRKTWFFERTGDSYVFACHEAEAWEIMSNRTNWMRRDFKMIGVSDGKTYAKIINESGAKARVLKSELDILKREQTRYMKAEENLMFDDLVKPEDDTPEGAKLRKVKEIIADYDARIDVQEDQYKKATSDVQKEAFNAELEVARGHLERPSNQNIMTPGASPTERAKIITAMGQNA